MNAIVQKVLKILTRDNRLLDIGCDGNRAIIYDHLPSYTIGLDICFEDLKKKSVRCVCGDAQVLPFKDKSFERMLMLETLEHLKDADKGLSEIKRVLKKDGEIIISTPNGFGLWSLLTDRILCFPKPQHLRHYSLFSLPKLKQLLKKNKLTIKSLYSVEGLGICRVIQAILHRNNVIGESKLWDWLYSVETRVAKLLPLSFHTGWIIKCIS